ncbi:ImmA/IrrE family metallo-endopeptidase [Clostridium sp. D2Q-14]|uniref:ImmA/IrrE family metallo-endopeptidase n=1 Tax=Anaeromonas gelatinilytica TaxID=2683194 RepID=UPI00193C23ED|nr:ImmA/IrrE family metallo-endopeptidase [Anaeromonas gelatinilytica]MBS4534469.1 ImmA/IrrE family metallo-endopeptidase [Anaeromonas gelatinilytica]
MNLPWVDDIIAGLVEIYKTRNIHELYQQLDIEIIKFSKDNILLRKGEAMYQRNYFGKEVVFIRDDLEYKYEKFILAHELGHALLHTKIYQAAYNNKLINKGKLEKQADYFALKLLNIKIDSIYYEGFTIEQISKALYVNEKSLEVYSI